MDIKQELLTDRSKQNIERPLPQRNARLHAARRAGWRSKKLF